MPDEPIVITPAMYKQMIIDEVGDEVESGNTTGIIAGSINNYWALYNDKSGAGVGGLYLQYLYAKAHAIRRLMAFARKQIDVKVGDRDRKASQLFEHLQEMLKDVNAEMKDKESDLKKGGKSRPVGGTLRQTAPIMATRQDLQTALDQRVANDANARDLRGDPYL